MTLLDQSCQFWKCKPDEVMPFDAEDVFNPPNRLEGFQCRIGDHRYGALYITAVNAIPCAPQVVWGTPKQHYPFDKQGNFHWLPCRKVNLYTKLDGTNILAYTYEFKGKEFITYKTRMTPIVRTSTFADFVAMWHEMLERYPRIPELVFETGLNLSFELYGSRNIHLIVYDVPLETRLLFGITRTIEPRIVDPEDIRVPQLPSPICFRADGFVCPTLKDLTSYYKKIQAEAEAMNEKTEVGIKGTEGYVLYYHLEDGTVKQFKCKPDTIERIHWSSGGVNKNVLRATVMNAYESESEVTVEVVKKLLLEEFQPQEVERWHYKIVEVIEEVKEEMVFRKKVKAVYASIGKNIAEDKREVMREMSKHFPKNKMSYVYWVIANT